MAVEAHYLLHAGGQKQLTTHAGWADGTGGGGGICWEAPATTAQALYGSEVVEVGKVSSQKQGYQQSCVGMIAPPSAAAAAGPVMMMGHYRQVACAADASESGVMSGRAQEVAAPRKRKRADNGQPPVLGVGVAAHLQQQLVDVDRLVLQHTAKMWAELAEQRRRYARQVVAVVEAAAAKRLRAKDEEIVRVGRLNWALEERVKTLFVEAQVWRDLAQSNEAAANALRGELQQALDAQARWGAARAAGADDAESCCGGENDVATGEEEDVRARSAARCCCCRAGTCACPVCGGAKNGSVRVNFS